MFNAQRQTLKSEGSAAILAEALRTGHWALSIEPVNFSFSHQMEARCLDDSVVTCY